MSFLLQKKEGMADQLYPLFEDRPMVIGRGEGADITVDDTEISREHCRLEKGADAFVLTDLESTNGTFVNGTQIVQVELANNDQIQLGDCTLHYIDAEADASQAPSDRVFLEYQDEKRAQRGDRAWNITVSTGKSTEVVSFIRPFCLVGSGKHCDVRFKGRGISFNHVLLVREGRELIVVNVSKGAHMFINGEQAERKVAKADEFTLTVGGESVIVTPE